MARAAVRSTHAVVIDMAVAVVLSDVEDGWVMRAFAKAVAPQLNAHAQTALLVAAGGISG